MELHDQRPKIVSHEKVLRRFDEAFDDRTVWQKIKDKLFRRKRKGRNI